MTFTLTIQDFSPSEDALERLLDGAADLRVEFEAYPRVYWDPVETDWPPVIQRGVSLDCDVGDVDIEEVLADVECEACRGTGENSPGIGGRRMLIHSGVCCRSCRGKRTQSLDILSRLSAPDLARLKEECAEYAMKHAVDYQAKY